MRQPIEHNKWCTYCRKDTHWDAECWCTRPAGFSRQNYLPMSSGLLPVLAKSSSQQAIQELLRGSVT